MGLLNKKELLAKEKIEVKEVDLGNGDFVYVKQMTGRERDQWERSLMKKKTDQNGNVDYEQSLDDFRAKLAVNTVCDETGKLILSKDDYPILSQHMSAAKLEKIINVAQELNKISDKDKEGLVKNLEGGQPASSSSGSVEN